MAEFFYDWLPNKLRINKYLGLQIFAGLVWAIWRTRNKMAKEKKLPNSPTETLLYGLSFLQKWETLLKEGDQDKVEQARLRLKEWCCSYVSIAPDN